MDPWSIAIGAGLGAIKSNADEARAERDRRVQSTKTRWSPWTGMQGRDVQSPDVLGTMMQGASAGAMFGQQFGGAPGGNPGGGAAPQGQQMGGWTPTGGGMGYQSLSGDPNSPRFMGPPNLYAGGR